MASPWRPHYYKMNVKKFGSKKEAEEYADKNSMHGVFVPIKDTKNKGVAVLFDRIGLENGNRSSN